MNKYLLNKYPITLIVIGVIAVGFTVYLAQTQGIAISFAFLSIVVATFFASGSLALTSKSLELTRNAIRPFIYTADSINVKRVEKYITLTFNIYNSGSLPGKDVYTDITFFDKDEEITEENLSSKYAPEEVKSKPSILFPNSKYYHSYIIDLNQEADSKIWDDIMQGKTKCRVRTTYTSLGRKYVTIQTEELAKQEWAEGIVTKPIPPQKWE